MDVPTVSTRGMFKPFCDVVVCAGAVVVGNDVNVEVAGDVAVDEVRNDSHSWWRCLGLSSVRTSPVAVSMAANRVVVPWCL